MSLLTGASLTAAEIARELDISHANASYHLRNLLSGGLIVVAGEERIRGGVAKRYRYDRRSNRGDPVRREDDEIGPATSHRARNDTPLPGRKLGPDGKLLADAELWVDRTCANRDRVAEVVRDLHRAPGRPKSRHPARQHHRRDVRDAGHRDRECSRSAAPPTFRYLAPAPSPRLGNSFAPIALAFAVLDLTGSARDLAWWSVPGPDQRGVPALRRGAGRPDAQATADGGLLPGRGGHSGRGRGPRAHRHRDDPAAHRARPG